jgi:hypothetical protein
MNIRIAGIQPWLGERSLSGHHDKPSIEGLYSMSNNTSSIFRRGSSGGPSQAKVSNRSHGTVTLPFVNQAKPRDLRFRGPFLEMFFDRAWRSGEWFAHSIRLNLTPKKQAGRTAKLSTGLT